MQNNPPRHGEQVFYPCLLDMMCNNVILQIVKKPWRVIHKYGNIFSCFGRGKGLILNISSGLASIPFPLYTLYTASKVSSQVFSGFPKSCEVTAHVICVPYRCLWKDFPKAFKVNTKIKGSLFRYFLIILKGFFVHQILEVLSHLSWFLGSGTIWCLHSNGSLSRDQHDNSVSRRFC